MELSRTLLLKIVSASDSILSMCLIIMYEKWETRQDLETHMHSVNMKAHQEAIQGAGLQVQVRILEQVV